MNTTRDPADVLTQLRPDIPVDPAALQRAHAKVTRAIANGENSVCPSAVRTASPRFARSTRRLTLLATSAAAVTAGVLLLEPAFETPAQASTPPLLHYSDAAVAAVADGTAPSGTQQATELAAIAAANAPDERTSDVTLVESAYWALNAIHDEDGTSLVLLPVERFVWASTTDGAMRFREVEGTSLSEDGSMSRPDVEPTGSALVDYSLPADRDRGTLDADALPRDTAALLDAVSQTRAPHGCGNLSDAAVRIDCLADALSALTKVGPVPPDLLSAFWTALAQEEEVRTLGTTVDRLGRTGVTLAYLAPEDSVDVMIIDPTTGRLLGTELIDVDGQITEQDSPAVFWFEVFQPARWVKDFGDI